MRSRWMVPAPAAASGVTLVAPKAEASDNGLAVNAPLMGWSGWGYLQRDPSAAKFRAQVDGTIVGQKSGLCLNVVGAKTTNGTGLQLWTCSGDDNQKWSLSYH